MHRHQYTSPFCGTGKISEESLYTGVSTGFSANIVDDRDVGFDLNHELVRNKPATFFLKVNCDAMKESGIHKEDVVIVDRSVRPATGSVIIAILNGEMLIRRFEKNKRNIVLRADTNKLSPINLDEYGEGFSIWGVVTYVIHKP